MPAWQEDEETTDCWFDEPLPGDRRSWAVPPGHGTYQGLDLERLDPDDEHERTFLLEAQHLELIKHAKVRGLTVPSYPALETHKKVSAAWLVERSGFVKGHGFGHVGISSKHALAIVNRGGASAAEVIALKEQIQTRVEEIWGVRLEPEPVMVGF